MTQLLVACVLKSGGRYDGSHAVRLQKMVARNLRRPHRFVCFTDTAPLDVPWCFLIRDWPGWWSKLELFRRDWREDCEVLYLDLDNIVVGSLDALLETPGDLVMVKDWWQQGYNSSVMVLRGVDDRVFYTAVVHGIPENMRGGDQEYICRHHQPVAFPLGMVQSFKADNLDVVEPTGVVVQFHGRPKYWDVEHAWIERALSD